MFRKVVVLEILRRPILTGVTCRLTVKRTPNHVNTFSPNLPNCQTHSNNSSAVFNIDIVIAPETHQIDTIKLKNCHRAKLGSKTQRMFLRNWSERSFEIL